MPKSCTTNTSKNVSNLHKNNDAWKKAAIQNNQTLSTYGKKMSNSIAKHF